MCYCEPVLHVLWSVFLISQSTLNPHRLLRARLKPPPAYRHQQVLRFSSESLRGDDSECLLTLFLLAAWAIGSFASVNSCVRMATTVWLWEDLSSPTCNLNLIQDICWHVAAQTRTSDPREHHSYSCTIYSVILSKCILYSHVSTVSNWFILN